MANPNSSFRPWPASLVGLTNVQFSVTVWLQSSKVKTTTLLKDCTSHGFPSNTKGFGLGYLGGRRSIFLQSRPWVPEMRQNYYLELFFKKKNYNRHTKRSKGSSIVTRKRCKSMVLLAQLDGAAQPPRHFTDHFTRASSRTLDLHSSLLALGILSSDWTKVGSPKVYGCTKENRRCHVKNYICDGICRACPSIIFLR